MRPAFGRRALVEASSGVSDATLISERRAGRQRPRSRPRSWNTAPPEAPENTGLPSRMTRALSASSLVSSSSAPATSAAAVMPVSVATPVTAAARIARGTPIAPAGLSTVEQLGEDIAALAARLHAATYELLVMLRRFDAASGWNNGFLSCAHWLHWRTGIDLGAAREKVRVARALPDLPRLSAAMQRGAISYAKVRAITRVATPANEAPAARRRADGDRVPGGARGPRLAALRSRGRRPPGRRAASASRAADLRRRRRDAGGARPPDARAGRGRAARARGGRRPVVARSA